VLPSDPITWLKIGGALLTGVGSLVLAWRIKVILKWVLYALVAHEVSIEQLRKVLDREPQNRPVIEGVTREVLDIESKLGLVLLIVGFVLLGAGMLCNAAGFYFAAS